MSWYNKSADIVIPRAFSVGSVKLSPTSYLSGSCLIMASNTTEAILVSNPVAVGTPLLLDGIVERLANNCSHGWLEFAL